jgi:hypothetical protein
MDNNKQTLCRNLTIILIWFEHAVCVKMYCQVDALQDSFEG